MRSWPSRAPSPHGREMSVFSRSFGLVLKVAGALAIGTAAAAAVYALGGFFDIATGSPSPPLLDWALIGVREASISRGADEVAAAPIPSPDLVERSARLYAELGCQDCHGGLGRRPARFSDGLDPPPNLKSAVKTLSASEIFWAVKHGIKMTGMPGFGRGPDAVPDPDLWALATFVKEVPSLSQDDLDAWAAPPGAKP